MMELEEHNILKIYIDVTTHHHTNGFAFKDELAEVGTEKLMPALSLLFDEMNFSTKNIIIEKLEIDAGILPAKCWKEALMKAVLNEMKKTLEQHAQTQNFQNQQQGGKQEFTPTQALLYFLETGLLSWYTTSSDPNEILGNLLLHEPQKILQVLRKTIQENPVALNRLVNQFQEKILQQLITKAGINERTSNNLRKRWNTLFSQLSMREQEKKEKIYSSIIKSVLIQAEQTNEALQLSIVIKNIENLSKEHRKKLIQLLINIPERKEQKGLYEIKKICYENAGEIGFSAEEK
ncbi:MAG: contractile injection system tape measure protein, partial [Chitinophagales bacterium]